MPRFAVGDRVQLTGDIARFYRCIVGIVVSDGGYPYSVLNQSRVRLADGTEGVFFDFQLETPPLVTARLIHDSSISPETKSVRGAAAERHVRFLGRDIDIHLKITESKTWTIAGQVVAGGTPRAQVQVTLLVQAMPADSIATNDLGEFTLRDVPSEDVGIEILLPSRRILAPLTP